ncbi:hypothetical protein M0G43_09190 [Subsaxibacter sp. CAU 1640]|uniref:hypothetical protein n=1 Tax=Subsaxibacter sp. CAU 1640 TaxID=2933271 RepID=UPI002006A75E|nr:hypothetical protein [Subsaxibacter sp. CAU 1640]MCK7590747.1 hypothetical protein [Subsaxibacter sp. CAU 1640]
MKTSIINSTILGMAFFFLASSAFAHPTGNMVTIGDAVVWSYINPLNDPNHYACVMIYTRGSQPKVYLQSEYTASDFMLYSKQNELYIIERRFLQATNEFQVRVLKATIDKQPTVIWDWFKDHYRIGEGGFFMRSDHEMVFAKYPDAYNLKKGEQPTTYFQFEHPIKRIRAVEHNQILLLADNACYLVDQNGKILKQWNDLIDQKVKHPPMNHNQVFDADYSNGELLLSYWGKRCFDVIDSNRKRYTILQQSEPLVPHWVAFWNKEKLLFSSRLIFDGTTPQPHLTLLNPQNNQTLLWTTP